MCLFIDACASAVQLEEAQKLKTRNLHAERKRRIELEGGGTQTSMEVG